MNQIRFLLLFCAFYLFVGLTNDGFMALDEYWVGITRYIPAQSSSIMNLVHEDDVKSPLQMMPMLAVSKAALALGVESPYWQYRTVIFILALISILVLARATYEFLKLDLGLNDSAKSYFWLLLTFYFGGSFALTRPMYEAVAAPWLFWSAIRALRYDLCPNIKDLVWGVVFVSITFALRPQLGFCALIFVALPLLKKRYLDLIPVAVTGIFFLFITGLPDLWIRGAWHHSLFQLTVYNYKHGADYGQKPITFYPLMFLALSLAPFLIRKVEIKTIKKYFFQFRIFWIYVGLFTFLHSLFPQKWERFMISMIPFILVLIWPILWFYQSQFQKFKFRMILIYVINFAILIVASFFPAQKNLIEFSRFLNNKPEIFNILRFDDTPGWITEVFIENRKVQFIEMDDTHLPNQSLDCHTILVLGEPQYQSLKANPVYDVLFNKLKQTARFDVNFIEQLSHKLNPKNNKRRVALLVFEPAQIKCR